MDDVKQQVADRLKQASNILVTVKTDPTIDLLAACIGLSLILDKIGKHATAVFSGEVPSAMEFLKPEETLEESPNSLRDFIISLDKSKADKLRYKVEDKVVRIFITPFKAGLSQDDLEFSQGDFNIDLLVALGVHEQAELDAAVTAHGRILHDATIISINNTPNGNLGTLNWQGTNVSSVSEMVAELANTLDKTVFDEQIATALLTGVVAETARFSNDKTSPQTMTMAAQLMAAGANQQLVATELQSATTVGAPGTVKAEVKPSDDNGTLEIEHAAMPEPPAEPKPESEPKPEPEQPTPPAEPESPQEPEPTVKPAERTMLPMPDPTRAGDNPVSDVASGFTGEFSDEDHASAGHSYLIDKAAEVAAGANSSSAAKPPLVDLPPVSSLPTNPVADDQGVLPAVPAMPTPLPPISPTPPAGDTHKDQTLEDIEASVKSAHTDKDAAAAGAAAAATSGRLDDARQQVLDALKQGTQPLEPLTSLNAHPLGDPLHEDAAAPAEAPALPAEPAPPAAIHVDDEGNLTTLPQIPDANHPDAAPNAPDTMTLPLPPLAPAVSSQPSSAPFASGSPLPPPPAGPPPIMPPNMG